MNASILTPADFALLATIGDNAIIADALQQLEAVKADYVEAKNARETAAGAEKDGKINLFATVMQVVMEVGALTASKHSLREIAFNTAMATYLDKEYPQGTVRAYAITGRSALVKLYGKVEDLESKGYADVRELLKPKSDIRLQFDGHKDAVSKSLGKAARNVTPEIVAVMEQIAELARRAEQLATAAKESKQATPKAARALNSLRMEQMEQAAAQTVAAAI